MNVARHQLEAVVFYNLQENFSSVDGNKIVQGTLVFRHRLTKSCCSHYVKFAFVRQPSVKCRFPLMFLFFCLWEMGNSNGYIQVSPELRTLVTKTLNILQHEQNVQFQVNNKSIYLLTVYRKTRKLRRNPGIVFKEILGHQ